MNEHKHFTIAKGYAEKGWQLFPVNIDKTPIPWKGMDAATDDIEQLKSWFNNSLDTNIAIHCQKSGLVIIDIDTHKEEENGFDTLKELEEKLGNLPKTVTAITGGGGRHLFFKSPGIKLKGSLGKGLDIKHNGYIVVPPSIHPSRKAYEWAEGLSPDDVEVAELPEAYLKILSTQKEVKKENASTEITQEFPEASAKNVYK